MILRAKDTVRISHRIPGDVRFKDGGRLFFIEADRIQRRENLVNQGLNACFAGHEAKQVHNLIYLSYDETPQTADQLKPFCERDLAPKQKLFTGFPNDVLNFVVGWFRVGFDQFSNQGRTVFYRRTHKDQAPENFSATFPDEILYSLSLIHISEPT